MRPVRRDRAVSHSFRLVSGKNPRNSGALPTGSVRGDRKFGFSEHHGAPTTAPSLVASFECPHLRCLTPTREPAQRSLREAAPIRSSFFPPPTDLVPAPGSGSSAYIGSEAFPIIPIRSLGGRPREFREIFWRARIWSRLEDCHERSTHSPQLASARVDRSAPSSRIRLPDVPQSTVPTAPQ